MDAKDLTDLIESGRLTPERLVALVVNLQNRLESVTKELEIALERIRELEKQSKTGPTPKLAEAFSMRAEQKRQEARGKLAKKKRKPHRRGRISTADKLKLVKEFENVFPVDCEPSQCVLSHSRVVWRIRNGQAVLIGYHVYRCGHRFGKIAGVLGRSEFCLEIMLSVAYQVYILGLSFDKVCALVGFFQNLPLKKSQADALLHQLARSWEAEFERLCILLAYSAVVQTDETGWSINSVWAFLSGQARVLLFGVHKDAETLAKILDPATYAGIVVSDDAAVYRNFTKSQKCWAHLIRKAIKLTLEKPDNAQYRNLTDELVSIYREACRIQRDQRLSEAGRAQKAKYWAGSDKEEVALRVSLQQP